MKVDNEKSMLICRDMELEQIVRKADNITEFQRKVYLELLKTRMGETLSYSEMAIRLGYSRSSAVCRAIGQALKRNPWGYGWQSAKEKLSATEVDMTLLRNCVPCHRVIRSDGSIGGYCGHTEGDKVTLKQTLLAAEKNIASNHKHKE